MRCVYGGGQAAEEEMSLLRSALVKSSPPEGMGGHKKTTLKIRVQVTFCINYIFTISSALSSYHTIMVKPLNSTARNA